MVGKHSPQIGDAVQVIAHCAWTDETGRVVEVGNRTVEVSLLTGLRTTVVTFHPSELRLVQGKLF